MTDIVAFHRPFDTRRLGNDAIQESISADATERDAIVAFLGIVSLERLDAQMRIEGWSKDGVLIEGRLRAIASQACVVTLEPVRQVIDEPFRLTFLPPGSRSADPRTVAEAEVIVEFDKDDPPEDLNGPVLDLGPILVEQLVLALDPYPRSEGAKIDDPAASESERQPSPFAALSRLKDK